METRDASDIQEKAVAKVLGGVRTANSGATPFSKGDVIVGNFIVECKTKMKECNSFTIQKDWLKTLDKERVQMNKRGCALAFSFDVGKTSYYVVDERMIKRLIAEISKDI